MVSRTSINLKKETHDKLKECRTYETEPLVRVLERLIYTYGEEINNG